MRFKDVRQMRLSTLKRFLRLPHFDQHLELHRLDCLSSNGRLDSYEFVQAKLQELDREELRPEPLITGRDLIRAGYTPGQAFGEALSAVGNGATGRRDSNARGGPKTGPADPGEGAS